MATSRHTLAHNALENELVKHGPFNRVDYQDSTGSTNSDLLAAAQNNAPNWTVATAEIQTSGRGRQGRTWTAPKSSQALFSMLFYPEAEKFDRLGTIPMISGLAVLDTLKQFNVVDAGLKWPNDVLLNQKKLAGILVEAEGLDSQPAVVIGIGVNIDLDQEELPVDSATSLSLAGYAVDRTEFLIRTLKNLHTRITQWSAGDTSWLAEYRQASSTLDEDVRVLLPGGREYQGLAVGIADRGELMVREDTGNLLTLNAGEVTHLRLQ